MKVYVEYYGHTLNTPRSIEPRNILQTLTEHKQQQKMLCSRADGHQRAHHIIRCATVPVNRHARSHSAYDFCRFCSRVLPSLNVTLMFYYAISLFPILGDRARNTGFVLDILRFRGISSKLRLPSSNDAGDNLVTNTYDCVLLRSDMLINVLCSCGCSIYA